MDLTIKTVPALTSIDNVLVKSNKRITHTKEDDLIDFWIAAADDYIERQCNIALMTQTLVLRLSMVLPVVSLPRPPLATITSVKYTKTDESEVEVLAAAYTQRKSEMLPTIIIPEIECEVSGEMEIEYVVGVTDPVEVPRSLRQAALLLSSHYVTSREAAYLDKRIMDVEKSIPFGVKALLANYRVPNINDGLNGGY